MRRRRNAPTLIVHTVASLRAEDGGPSRSVTALCTALASSGQDVGILTTRKQTEGPAIHPDDEVQVQVVDRPASWQLLGPFRDSFSDALQSLVAGQGQPLLHDHGIWLATNHVSARTARRNHIPRVVSVRGMMSDWALAQSRVRKSIAWRLYQRRDLLDAALIHVTSRIELAQVRRKGIKTPFAVIPNGVDIPESISTPADPVGARSALFLSRIHRGKGLLDLVVAWSTVRPRGWRLLIAGPDEDGHRAEVERLVSEQGISEEVDFVGPVDDHRKWDLYRKAGLFILPSHSENFGIVVAEAMAAGLPVITTKGAPWQELQTHRCGWWVDVDVPSIASALREATALTSEERAAMGERGRSLVRERYTWRGVATQMSEAYAWVLGEAPRPDFIHL
jgi:glycosyltransferase involved in cell wall biosynthesis